MHRHGTSCFKSHPRRLGNVQLTTTTNLFSSTVVLGSEMRELGVVDVDASLDVWTVGATEAVGLLLVDEPVR